MKYQIVITAVLMALLGVFVGWMFGFDFDHRNADTGTFTIVGLVVVSMVLLIYRSLVKYG